MLEKVKTFIKGLFSDFRKSVVTVLVLAFIVGLIATIIHSKIDQKARQEAIERGRQNIEQAQEASNSSNNSSSEDDVYLMKIQDSLVKTYGPLPSGYLWETNGTLLSLGDPSMSAEDVVYAYLNGVRSLDLSMAQKYSRRSLVVSTYESYFSSSAVNGDYTDSFVRNMYKEVMLSLQPLEIIDTSVFAENKQVFTLKLNVLDLSSKDFWIADKEEIYKNLYIYSSDEDDLAKSDMYLYDYVLNYYRSGNAVTRDVLINLTVERFPDLNTGWLVSIDSDLNDLCNYKDGNTVVNYIKDQFRTEGVQSILTQRSEEAAKALEESKKKEKKTEESSSEELSPEESSTEVQQEEPVPVD